MRVAVVTPYHTEPPSLLHACLDSVAHQTHRATHILVADGHPRAELDKREGALHLKLPQESGDNGGTPRALGTLYAAGQGFDAVAYLDADNWFEDDHIETLVELAGRTGHPIVISGKTIFRLDGSPMPLGEQQDGEHYTDTSCILLTRPVFHLAQIWALMPKELAPSADRFFWAIVRAKGIPWSKSTRDSLCFRTKYADHYRFLGEEPPEGAKPTEVLAGAQRWWDNLSEDDRQAALKRMGL
jgi:glycosyltransferase involved in cell wall biosynthesis